jgi:hypothetical protein
VHAAKIEVGDPERDRERDDSPISLRSRWSAARSGASALATKDRSTHYVLFSQDGSPVIAVRFTTMGGSTICVQSKLAQAILHSCLQQIL